MITQEMLIASTFNVLEHAQKHMYEARDILRVLDSEHLTLGEKLTLIASLKDHIGIIQGDAARALLIVGE